MSGKNFEIERRKADEDFRKSQTFLDSVIENIPDMIFVKDAKELRFVRFNKAGEELLGFSRNELIGKNDYDFFTQREADFFTEKDREVLKSGKLFEIREEPIHTKTKGVRILHTKKIPILDNHGKPQYLLGISEDITERKAMEKEILEISDREQRRIGQDLHDGLGQHLTGIAFLSKVLFQKLASKNHPEFNDAAQIVDLVNQAVAHTRDLARLLYPVELESNGLTAALQELATSTTKMFHVDCRFICEENITIYDKNIASHLYRIAQESVDNALKHSKAKSVVVEMYNLKGTISLVIKDDGVGFPETPSKNGLGMGLSIMHHRARMIAASLNFCPNIGGGTVVTCTFQKDAQVD